jgi:2-polyprenyl-3-methyl-5-hydroxy-6-metoxy-1,4-benzoquinol methylase
MGGKNTSIQRTGAPMSEDILQQQIAYYRARAGEYDEWFYRLNRYDRGTELNQQWFDEVAVVLQEVKNLGHGGDALELACGTGIWTRELAPIADTVTALDASEEVIALNREKLNATNVHYRQADLFAWEPDRQYDMVFFSFWLSHVPPERLAPFLATVNRAVKPGGQIFMIDSRPDETSTAKDNPLRNDEHIYRTRKLNDGSTYTIVKVFYEPNELRDALASAGFKADVQTTEHYFIYAHTVKENEPHAVS